MIRLRKNSSVFFCLLLLSSCLARPAVEMHEQDTHLLQNAKIEAAVRKYAQTGDWLVTRGYHLSDNLVANATSVPISHVAVYDAEGGMVVEAEGKGVHLTKLEEFVNKSYRLLIIRPRWHSGAHGKAAMQQAMKMVGKSYDFLGTVGFNYPDRYYCSELAVMIYKKYFSPKEKFPTVIKPGELYLYGKILYDSRPRDEMEE